MDLTTEQMARLLDEAVVGSQEAAQQLTTQYGPFLRLAVRRWLHQRLRSMYDSVDFVQDVWASFFARGFNRETFSHPSQLIAFLQVMARNKVVSAYRQRLGSKKADLSRERSLHAAEQQGASIVDRQPTPSQIVSGDEEWQKLLDGLRPAPREILRRYGAGQDVATISRELEISEKTVQRVLKHVLAKLRPTG